MCCTALIWMLCNRSRYPTRNAYLFALVGAFIKVGSFIVDCTALYSDLKVVDAIDSWEEDHGLSTTDQAVGSAIPDKIYADYPLKEVVYTVIAAIVIGIITEAIGTWVLCKYHRTGEDKDESKEKHLGFFLHVVDFAIIDTPGFVTGIMWLSSISAVDDGLRTGRWDPECNNTERSCDFFAWTGHEDDAELFQEEADSSVRAAIMSLVVHAGSVCYVMFCFYALLKYRAQRRSEA